MCQRRGVTRDRDVRAHSDLNYAFTKQYTSLNLAFTRLQITMCENANAFYYIKVSGIASGNKLIKTIRYPHM